MLQTFVADTRICSYFEVMLFAVFALILVPNQQIVTLSIRNFD